MKRISKHIAAAVLCTLFAGLGLLYAQNPVGSWAYRIRPKYEGLFRDSRSVPVLALSFSPHDTMQSLARDLSDTLRMVPADSQGVTIEWIATDNKESGFFRLTSWKEAAPLEPEEVH